MPLWTRIRPEKRYPGGDIARIRRFARLRSPVQSPAAYARQPTAPHTRAALLDAGLVVAGAGVDADGVAHFDEDRDLDDQPTFYGRGLAGAALRVSGEARLGVDHLEIDGDGQLDADGLALV